jgi:hypothetical protein
VRSSFTLALGGAQCKDSNAQQAQSSQSDDGSRSPAGLAGAMAGLGGLFHKNKDDAERPCRAADACRSRL